MPAEPPFSPEEERLLIARCQHGDREAFAKIVLAFRERAFAGALALVQNHEDARDLTQDAFVKAFRHIDRFQLGRPFYAWYYRILRNTCLSYIQRYGTSRQVSLDQLIEEHAIQPADQHKGVREKLQREETAVHIREAVDSLKPDFKEILAMKHFEEMSYDEIAHALRVPIGTVMSRLYYARRALRQAMEKRGFNGREA